MERNLRDKDYIRNNFGRVMFSMGIFVMPEYIDGVAKNGHPVNVSDITDQFSFDEFMEMGREFFRQQGEIINNQEGLVIQATAAVIADVYAGRHPGRGAEMYRAYVLNTK